MVSEALGAPPTLLVVVFGTSLPPNTNTRLWSHEPSVGRCSVLARVQQKADTAFAKMVALSGRTKGQNSKGILLLEAAFLGQMLHSKSQVTDTRFHSKRVDTQYQ